MAAEALAGRRAADGALRWSNVALEASVVYVLLSAWARPRDGDALLLPPAVCLALPAGLLVARVLEWTAAQSSTRQVAGVLCAVAWGLAAARLSAPAGFWQTDAPRAVLLVSAIFGGPVRGGFQPLAFWASLLLWWRGSLLLEWLPGLDDALSRLRLGGLAVGAVVLLLARGDRGEAGHFGQVELFASVAAFLVAAVVCTGLSRRREMAGGAPAAPTLTEDQAPRTAGRGVAAAIAMLVGLGALVLAAWGADVVTPGLLAPAVSAVGEALGALAAALARLGQAIAGLWPTPQASGPGTPTPTPAPEVGEPLRLPRLELPSWLGLVLAIGMLVASLIVIGNMSAVAIRALFESTNNAPNPVTGLEPAPSRPAEERGPIAVLARLLRLFRRPFRPAARCRGASGAAQASAARDSDIGSIRDAYRELLKWAAARGCVRRPAETPDELRRRLSAACPPREAEIELLTTLYVAARYGRSDVSADRLERAREALVRVRAAPIEDDEKPRDDAAIARQGSPGRSV